MQKFEISLQLYSLNVSEWLVYELCCLNRGFDLTPGIKIGNEIRIGIHINKKTGFLFYV